MSGRFFNRRNLRSGEFDFFAEDGKMNSLRREFSHLRRVNRFRAAIDAIAAGENARIRGLHQFIDDDATFFVG